MWTPWWYPQSNMPDDVRCFPGPSVWKGSESAFGRVKIFLSLGIWKRWPPIRLSLLTEKSFTDMEIATNYSPEAQLPLGVTSSTTSFEFLLLRDNMSYEWNTPGPPLATKSAWAGHGAVQHGCPWGLKEPTSLCPCQILGQFLSQLGQATILVLQETASAASCYATCMCL